MRCADRVKRIRILRKWIGLTVGIALVAFPFVRYGYGCYRTGELLERAESMVEESVIERIVVDNGEVDNGVGEMECYVDRKDKEVIGMIEIEDIGVKYPIVEGAGQEKLRYAIGHVEGTASIGDAGNCVLAGHRGSRFGTFFKRIGELEIGDTIVLTDLNGMDYRYEVVESFVVAPEDVWVLEQDGEERVTLISCENEGRKRRIVVGVIKNFRTTFLN